MRGFGGIVGWNTTSSEIYACVNRGKVSGYSNVGGIAGYSGAGSEVPPHEKSKVNDASKKNVNEGVVTGVSSVGDICGVQN